MDLRTVAKIALIPSLVIMSSIAAAPSVLSQIGENAIVKSFISRQAKKAGAEEYEDDNS